MKRFEFIDALKGFAILLVVMGHIIPWNFVSFEHAIELQPTPILLWKVIYMFHMPLFIFISGFLFGLSNFESIKEYVAKMYKKGKILLIPYIVSGILVYMWRGVRPLTYWYLLTLFQLLVIVGCTNRIANCIKSKIIRIVVEILILLTILVLLNIIPRYFDHQYLHVGYEWYSHLREMFPYFVLGYLTMRYISIDSIMNNFLYTLSILFFVIGLVIQIPHTTFLSINLVSLAGIYLCFYIFNCCFVDGVVVNYLKRIGKRTMSIYILHLFFVIQIVSIGDFFIELSKSGRMAFVSCFVLQFLFSLSLSLIIMEMSLFLARLIKTSKLLSILILGDFQEKKN